jgi:hypothetical protein
MALQEPSLEMRLKHGYSDFQNVIGKDSLAKKTYKKAGFSTEKAHYPHLIFSLAKSLSHEKLIE